MTVSPSKIMFLASNPKDTDSLRQMEEMREIDDRIADTHYAHGGRIKLEKQGAVRFSDLSRFLLRLRPNVMHFSGHGSSSGELYTEDAVGGSHPIAPEALASLLEQFPHVELVVLNACWSTAHAEALRRIVPCIIGMSRSISDKAAIYFARSLYQSLCAGESVQRAYMQARADLAIANLKNAEYTVQLLTRDDIDPNRMFLIKLSSSGQPT